MSTICPIRRVILVPGLLEPHAAFWPLKRILSRHCDRVEFFPDRMIFRDVERSVQRLADTIIDVNGDRSIAIVTHSFGDWIARQAISQRPDHHVDALVSVTPVMRSGIVTTGLSWVSGNWIPEIRIITDREQACENLDCDDRLRRLVIWAKADEFIRSVDLNHIGNVEVERIAATHLTVILQRYVLKKIESYLFGAVMNR